MKNQLLELLRGVICVSLPTDTARRENASRELAQFGVAAWEWQDGVFADSPEVIDVILAGKVRFSPPCFRCEKEDCTCENNFLTFPQIAVSLAYRHLWERIVRNSEGGEDLFLVCEDDIAFTERAVEGAGAVAASIRNGALDRKVPLLVRLGWALGKDHSSREAFSLEANRVRMSNPCYLLNALMAKRLLESHTEIRHTVDVFTHREENRKGGHFAVFPPLAFEHSWSTGRFESSIFPRKTREKYLRRQKSWGKRVMMWLGGTVPPESIAVRKRFEFVEGLFVLDGDTDQSVAEMRSRLPENIGIAIWTRRDGWICSDGAVVPEWGCWYRRLGASASLLPELTGKGSTLPVIENENMLIKAQEISVVRASEPGAWTLIALLLLRLEHGSKRRDPLSSIDEVILQFQKLNEIT